MHAQCTSASTYNKTIQHLSAQHAQQPLTAACIGMRPTHARTLNGSRYSIAQTNTKNWPFLRMRCWSIWWLEVRVTVFGVAHAEQSHQEQNITTQKCTSSHSLCWIWDCIWLRQIRYCFYLRDVFIGLKWFSNEMHAVVVPGAWRVRVKNDNPKCDDKHVFSVFRAPCQKGPSWMLTIRSADAAAAAAHCCCCCWDVRFNINLWKMITCVDAERNRRCWCGWWLAGVGHWCSWWCFGGVFVVDGGTIIVVRIAAIIIVFADNGWRTR